MPIVTNNTPLLYPLIFMIQFNVTQDAGEGLAGTVNHFYGCKFWQTTF